MLFSRLPPVPRAKILAYIDGPSYEAWVGIRDMGVAPGLTLLEVVETMDRCYPIAGPSAILVARTSAVIDQRYVELAALEI